MHLRNIFESCNIFNKDEIGYKFTAESDGVVIGIIKTKECGSYNLYTEGDNQSIFLGEDQVDIIKVKCSKGKDVVFSSNKVPKELQIFEIIP